MTPLLRTVLTSDFVEMDQRLLSVDVKSMLEDELAWLSNFVTSENIENRETDNTLLAGHLKLIKTLLTCEGINKRDVGRFKILTF